MWLIPKMAQPQVPLSKKSETHKVSFHVCPHTTRLEGKKNEKRVVVVIVAGGEWCVGYSNVQRSGLLM
jgi:hypothetical protein